MSNLKPWEINQKIANALETIAISKVSKFYPSYIAKITGLPLGIVIEKLDEYEKQEALSIKFEFICEECSRSILTIDKQSCFDLEVDCTSCGTENHFDPLDAVPIVELSDDFSQSFSKKKRSARELMLV